MTSDNCADCGQSINVTQRVYRSSTGGPRCGTCQFEADMDVEFEQLSRVLAVIEKRVRVLGVVALGELGAIAPRKLDS